MNLYTTLQKLCATPSVSGREETIREVLGERIAPFADELRTDPLGNLIAVKRGSGTGKSVLLCAHMDEIGFLVTFVEENGFLRIAPVGGVDLTAAAYSAVVSENGVHGVIVPEENTKPADYTADRFVIDIGAKNRKEAERQITVGTYFVIEGGVRRLRGKRVMGRPLDDRIGCAVLLSVAEQLVEEHLDGDVYYVFSVQEEVGCRGAAPAAFGLAPDYALCFDVTGTGDTVGAKPMACTLGGGAAVKIKDKSVICCEEVTSRLCELADSQKIPYQREILTYGGTDTSSMQLAGSGCRAGALSIPCRYIHTPNEQCDLADAEACIALASAFIRSI